MLVAPNTPQQGTESESTEITNHPFFPSLLLADFRDVERVDATASESRAGVALYNAMLDANTRLADWMAEQTAQGITELSNVPQKPGHPPGANLRLYKQAVYSLAKAALLELLHDYDSTGDTPTENSNAANECRRNAAWAINDLTNVPRVTIELI
ncbi:head completion protein GPL [Alteromonadaceae bacterium 2753L.S.0a.02]|nr:head completion protein GPL [Alteromonadaceae bacterium 2753L.S.0a.02]